MSSIAPIAHRMVFWPVVVAAVAVAGCAGHARPQAVAARPSPAVRATIVTPMHAMPSARLAPSSDAVEIRFLRAQLQRVTQQRDLAWARLRAVTAPRAVPTAKPSSPQPHESDVFTSLSTSPQP
jgi:hypothetical protein